MFLKKLFKICAKFVVITSIFSLPFALIFSLKFRFKKCASPWYFKIKTETILSVDFEQIY